MNVKKGVNQDSIQAMNRTLLINLLRAEKSCSRVHLANLSGLKQATVTNIINDFIEWGYVKETGSLVGNKGRRSIGIALNENNHFVLGVRLSRKYFVVAVFDLNGTCRFEQRLDVAQEQSPQETFNGIQQTITNIINKQNNFHIHVIGMSIPGPFIKQNDRIALMTGSTPWNNISIKEDLEKTFQCPVFLEHDANAGGLAQLWHDKEAVKSESLVYIAAGQGIGAGVMYNAKILKGELGLAGEIGHTSICYDGALCGCGNRGCLEGYCSSIAFTYAVSERKGSSTILKFQEVRQLFDNGDLDCMKEYVKACYYLGVGVVNVVNNFNPSIIIIGDEMAELAPEIMLEQVISVVKSRILPEVYENLQIKISSLKKDPALLGAGIVAIHQVFADLERFAKRHLNRVGSRFS